MATETYTARPPLRIEEDEITGYADPWIISPGEKTDIKISSTKANLNYRLIRLLPGLDVPHAPASSKQIIDPGPHGELTGRFQASHPGSFARVDAWAREPLLHKAEGLEIAFHAQPWMLHAKFAQAFVSTLNVEKSAGFSVLLDPKNNLVIWIGTDDGVQTLKIAFDVRVQRWFHTTIMIKGKEVDVNITHLPSDNEIAPPPTVFHRFLKSPAKLESGSPLFFASSLAVGPTKASNIPIHFFNGRLDSPCFKALGSRPWHIATYDFSLGIDTDEILDVSGSNLHGVLINAPTRAVRGYNYDHKLIGLSWKEAKYGFGAIHFHDDDLDDAAWETDLTITVPEGLRSGAYAVEVSDTESDLKDSIVFFVRPKEVRPQAKIAFVFSTMTYLAYANEHMYDETKSTHISFPEGVQLVTSDNYYKMLRRSDLGLAIYDLHSDGSGVVYSTCKRPILNMRPDYIHWGFQRPREFSADLLMVGFLEKLFGDGYDVLTDHDLHQRGPGALASYDIVISGSHPEYPSMETLDAYEGFARNGGSLIYAGGNGFYWRSVIDSKRPHRMEVRRADVGARTHELPAGERYHSLNGQLGGLWRSLGRAPNLLFGIGSSASGKGPGRPFIPTDEALADSSLSWLWKGLNSESRKRLGTRGLAGGASGDELDRLDYGIGSPRNTILLARSERHDDHFMLFNEELIFPMIGTLGSTSPLVRSDMVYYETCGGGSVFSVGSINWNNSLAWDDYNNDIAQVTENVLREFLARGQRSRDSFHSNTTEAFSYQTATWKRMLPRQPPIRSITRHTYAWGTWMARDTVETIAEQQSPKTNQTRASPNQYDVDKKKTDSDRSNGTLLRMETLYFLVVGHEYNTQDWLFTWNDPDKEDVIPWRIGHRYPKTAVRDVMRVALKDYGLDMFQSKQVEGTNESYVEFRKEYRLTQGKIPLIEKQLLLVDNAISPRTALNRGM
ncbi:NN-dimethylformamidase beta subunit [Paramyrothecium foliicola]|nr:NN-dimethylformamidase beta subunit [Paramyrothecium foliicola]